MIFFRKMRLMFYSLIMMLLAMAWTPCAEALGGKYVFLFVGDGMGISQRVAAAQFAGKPLVMDTFPSHGLTTTRAANRFITDSAAAATALACGEKTKIGVLGLDRHLKPLKTIAEMARDQGMKVGIVTSVSLDNATPAGFYAHVPVRNRYHDIALALVKSGFHYFGGGGLMAPENKGGTPDTMPDNVLNLARKKGYTLTTTRQDFTAFAPDDGKLIAMNPHLAKKKSLPYALDRTKEDISLAEFTRKGIELLDGKAGFFMMVEGGKIDWACHANDAATAVGDILAFDDAIAVAYRFYEKHPRETLIVVTADHECGGMALGFAGTGSETDFALLGRQTVSFEQFRNELAGLITSRKSFPSFDEIKPLIASRFGLRFKGSIFHTIFYGPALTAFETGLIQAAYEKSLITLHKKNVKLSREISMVPKPKKKRISSHDEEVLLYGREDPLTVTLTRILNRRAGIAWTTFSHTGVSVLTSAIGVGHEAFLGMYDNTDIGKKLMALMGATAH